MREMTLSGLLLQYGPLMRYIIAPILPDSRDREECLQDAAMKAWNQLDRFNPNRGSFTTWLTVITRNTALNYARRKHPETEALPEQMEDPNSNPENILIARERKEALKKVLAALSLSDRTLFYRKYYYRQSTAQIASETGLTLRAVEGRLYRIKQKLRKELGGDLYD
ncbi:MAG: sigma-70 family RNA polymerase sigma factor [Oscillospiraceae bacterium]|nr:sigma-70 family RNA polymerase sigma factor [Oscillospiraceae bacterium]